MDGRLAILFGVMSLFGDEYQSSGIQIDRGDISGHIVASAGPIQRKDGLGRFEYRLSYALPQKWGPFNKMVDFSITDAGGIWVGAGLYQQFDIDIGEPDIFVGFYFAPGLYFKGDDLDLGFPIEFRSGVEIGVRLENDWQISISYDHRSNGDIGLVNPGMETVQLRISKPFRN